MSHVSFSTLLVTFKREKRGKYYFDAPRNLSIRDTIKGFLDYLSGGSECSSLNKIKLNL